MARKFRFLILILALLLSLSCFVACGNKEGDEETYLDLGETDEFFPDIERKDYNEDVNVYIMGASNPPEYFLLASEDDNDGSTMDEAVFQRQDIC